MSSAGTRQAITDVAGDPSPRSAAPQAPRIQPERPADQGAAERVTMA